MGRTLEQIQSEKPAVVAEATAKAKAILNDFESAAESDQSRACSRGNDAKSDSADKA
jgi:vacuolar-type H+-ATPase subunit H